MFKINEHFGIIDTEKNIDQNLVAFLWGIIDTITLEKRYDESCVIALAVPSNKAEPSNREGFWMVLFGEESDCAIPVT